MRVYLKSSTLNDIELSSESTLEECREVMERNKLFLISLNDKLKETKYNIIKETENGFIYTVTREVITEGIGVKTEVITEVITAEVFIK